MSLQRCPSFPSLLAAFVVPALLAACGGNVVVTGGGEGGSGGDGGSGGTPTITTGAGGCGAALTECEGVCVNLALDPDNCGSCFFSCQGGSCQGGECVIAPGCPPGLTDCNGSCVDTATDPDHCGGCFNECALGKACQGGNCVDPCLCQGNICNYFNLGSEVPQSATIAVASAENAFQVDCTVAGDWPDISFLWEAPYKGVFVFNTLGSEDTALQVMSTGCALYACNDDAAPSGASQVTLELNAGQEVLIVVEVIDSASTVTLNIAEDQQCASCSEYISGENFEDPLCPDSEVLYNDLVTCICEGACGMVCFDACGGGDFTQECQDCIFDPVNGCGNQFNECANDV